MDRRKFISKLGAAAGVGAVAIANSAHASKKENEIPEPPLSSVAKNALPPEFKVDEVTGEITQTPGQRTAFQRCFGCFDNCGLRVRVDEKTDKILRLSGNPYCENNNGAPLDLKVPVKEAFKRLTGDAGLANRATTCGRGTAATDAVDDERRITQVLKRAGKRGEGKWQTIPYEQALEEIVEGGDLFGEGKVAGLREIRQLDKEAAPGQPEFGSAANHLCTTYLSEHAPRSDFYTRFMYSSWGTRNVGKKSAYCGAQQRLGLALAAVDPLQGAWHAHPDWKEAEYAIFLGTSPGNSGNSLNSLGRQLADARVDNKLKYISVDPLLRTTPSANTGGEWVPIKPGRDTPFLFALMRLIFENHWYNASHLATPNASAAKLKGELHHTNASHLVIMDPSHPRHGKFLRCSDLGMATNNPVVFDNKTGKVADAETVRDGELFVDAELEDGSGKKVKVQSSLSIMRAEAMRTSLSDYAEATGISEAKLKQIAKDFTSHGRRSCVMLSTASNSADGFVTGWMTGMLNTLIGSHHAKGGAAYWHGFHRGSKGDRYELSKVEGGFSKKQLGISASREGKYELSTEYKTKLAKGQSPYPAKSPWMQIAPVGHAGEMLTSHANSDPYRFRAFFCWRNNVTYGNSGLSQKVIESLKDPKLLGLSVGIDCHLNETTSLCDYIIPDLSAHEEYAADRMWGAEMKGFSAGAPVVNPRTVKDKQGRHVCMERFLIDVALMLKLPGFGKNAIKAKDGRMVDLFTLEDWNARYLANTAMLCQNLPQVTKEDMRWSGAERAMQPLNDKLTATERAAVAAVLSRGGYYENVSRYSGDFLSGHKGRCLRIYNEAVTDYIHAYSGQPYPGIPTYRPNHFWNGDSWEQHWSQKEFPLLFSSYKSVIRSPYSVAFKRTAEFSPTNYVYMNVHTAQEFGLKSGDKVRITSPSGQHTDGELQTDDGVVKGAISVSTGFGHTRGFGGDERIIDGKVIQAIKERATGTSVNPMLPTDPTRSGASLLLDYWTGCTARHGVSVKVTKLS
ncbi:Molybdopterin oxidoreductase [Desulfuromusa kysingii]|uniref:Molybdopterin oxidoreductase n=1 Tax=Desulfuromusa kysingii TaxID=37625 RepID=A0A1H4DJY1_9BACT|nr:molybdopterin dinucleotide binding domain-containing protein [Desulfuromusa kysingii]SEA73024.1 Molybdopterin oxidoreductase [Desulfuromusa kysingii]